MKATSDFEPVSGEDRAEERHKEHKCFLDKGLFVREEWTLGRCEDSHESHGGVYMLLCDGPGLEREVRT